MNILFVGCGAVTTVMIQQLTHIASIYHRDLHYVILARSSKVTSELDQLSIPYQLLIESDFGHFFTQTNIHETQFDRVINTSIPEFNTTIMSWAILNHCCYMDLASILASDDVIAGNVEQFKFDQQFKKKSLKAIINAGISPGLTEILIAYVVKQYQMNPQSITITLDENFNCLTPLFSRSPRVAIEEILTLPLWMKNGSWQIGQTCQQTTLCSTTTKYKDYIRLTQEELVSLYTGYPSLTDLQILAGGSEIEHIKFLYHVGILQDQEMLGRLLVKIPSAASRDQITNAYRKGLIDDAGFQAQIFIADETQSKIITINFDWKTFKHIQETSYAGSTSISYPTGVSAAWIRYLAHITSDLDGVCNCLQLGNATDTVIFTQLISALIEQGIQIDITSSPLILK